MGFTSKGVDYTVATMTDEQLIAMKNYDKLPLLAKACQMELDSRVKNENNN